MTTTPNDANSDFSPLDVTASLINRTVTTADVISDSLDVEEVGEVEESRDFVPLSPKTLQETGLKAAELSPLLLKFLFLHGVQSGSGIADQVKLPFAVVDACLAELKAELLVSIKATSVVGDSVFELTPKGTDQARLHLERSTYCGAAPVSFSEYKTAVIRQSIKNTRPKFDDVAGALHGLVTSKMMVSQLGQAINAGRSMFLYGPPGNGKSTIARRVIQSVSKYIWIPRSISIGSDVIRLYDPSLHHAAPMPKNDGLTRSTEIDERWIRIERPCIVVGGELTLGHLEARLNHHTGIIESPIHLKSNCGCLIVDDFGRQQISSNELLNRWIVPMEAGHDYIALPSGRQVQLPFDQLLIFSTNLAPQRLCDEAFLRRIPYKIEVFDPTELQFRQLFNLLAKKHNVQTGPDVLDYLIEHHYKRVGRPFRFCHVQDLLFQARDFCEFHGKQWTLNKEVAELACMNYFAGIQYDDPKTPAS